MSQADNSDRTFDLSVWTGDFIAGFISPWFNGAGVSSFAIVSEISVLLDLYMAIAILSTR
jgi:hypothetical protein